MKKGFVYWDDLDGEKNSNDKDGTLPNGTYDRNTRIEFCCRTDGNKDNPILLPSERPFFLLAYESPKCQMVKWVTASPEWIYYDTEEERNADDRGGAFPYHAGVKHPTIYYCYYQGKLIADEGGKGGFTPLYEVHRYGRPILYGF